MTDPIDLPDEQTPSRIHRGDPWTPVEPGAVADVDIDAPVTANQRIAEFRKKYPTGRIETFVSATEPEVTKIQPFQDEPVRELSEATVVFARAEVFVDQRSKHPLATAHAVRGSSDSNVIVAERPHETAETVAVSRALRYAGFGIPQ